ncbi:MAG: preprotein translocase subunit SecG [Proteobacteria bacterium]|nr:preprotein translocase subunit SecG [Pseudomonadota bacterium]
MSVNLLLIFFVLVVVAMIAFVLVQKGTGATAGSAFGGGASNTVFGAKGSGNFLTKTTMALAFLFFAVSMYMAVQASKQFTTATTGEIDLGVVGTLDTSDSDIPGVLSTEPVEGDVPGDVPGDVSGDVPDDDAPDLKEKIIDKATEIKDGTVEKTGDVKDVVVGKAIDAKDAVKDKAVEVKDAVVEKADEVKEAAEEKAAKIKDSIDG